MKKIATIAMCACALAITGCKTGGDHSLPDAATLRAVGQAAGMAAGYACGFADLDDDTLSAISMVADVMVKVEPSEGQTIPQAWAAASKEVCDRLVADGRLDSKKAAAVNGVVGLAATGYTIVEARYPGIKEYRERLLALSAGFAEGLKSTLPDCAECESCTVDREVYMEVLKAARSAK